jgi:hypothetical protein
VAAAEACGHGVRLKWPNDLLLEGRKVGGILVEATPSKAICGIGINLSWAPAGAAQLDQPRNQVLRRLRKAIEKWCSAPPEDVLVRWRQLSDTLGRKVRVELPGRSFEGIAQDVDSQGELIVDGTVVTAGRRRHRLSKQHHGGLHAATSADLASRRQLDIEPRLDLNAWLAGAAVEALYRAPGAVDLDHAPAARFLVEAVGVLGHDRGQHSRGLERGERVMAGVRPCSEGDRAALLRHAPVGARIL